MTPEKHHPTSRPTAQRVTTLCAILTVLATVAGVAADAARASALSDLSGLRLELVVEGIHFPAPDGRSSFPVAVATNGDGRLYVAVKSGRIVVVESGALREEAYLDLSERVHTVGEKGLLGLAFHPDFAENGWVFVTYSEAGSGDSILARFTQLPSASTAPGDVAQPALDPDSEAVLLRIPFEGPDHRGGDLHFGPDGYLYVSTGDGWWGRGQDFDPTCSAQSDTLLRGKILRLDVDQGTEETPFHAVPNDNPHGATGTPGPIWARGLRNPWRFDVDPVTGELWIGDVGSGQREEIDRMSTADGGANFGWAMMEGSLCVKTPPPCAGTVPTCGDPKLELPFHEYTHDDGCSVIGGIVYRGAAIPELAGHYLFADWCTGEVQALAPGEDPVVVETPLALPYMVSFGRDQDGEPLVLHGNNIYRILGPPRSTDPCLPDAHTLCINQSRFEVSATWAMRNGATGDAMKADLTADSGWFWFFSNENPEIFVKVKDACIEPFVRFWVFISGLTNVEVEVRIRDTMTGDVKIYRNPLGAQFETVQDLDAFDTCAVR